MDSYQSILVERLFAPIATLEGIGVKRAKMYRNLNINSVRDLLLYMPYKILIRKINPKILDIKNGDQISKEVTVIKTNFAFSSSRPSKIFCKSNDNINIELTYFRANPKMLSERFFAGQKFIVCGEVTIHHNIVEIVHPTQIVACDQQYKIDKFEPIYNSTLGLNSKFIGLSIKKVLSKLPQFSEWLPNETLLGSKWPSFNRALEIIHHPTTLQDVNDTQLAKQRLAFDEMLSHQLKLHNIRTKFKNLSMSPFALKNDLKQELIAKLQFQLTNAQEKVIEEIELDLKNNYYTNRLIQGDVGSGKTIVALILMLGIVDAGFQTALMVPTEILALQHFKTINSLVSDLGIKCSLLIGGMSQANKNTVQKEISSGQTNIVIGTHALFQQKVDYKNLKMVVIDEQHRFGVNQRLQLQTKGHEVSLIMMTATPIPRTLEMVNYGDMDVSTISQKPASRKEIITTVMSDEKLKELETSLNCKIKTGEKIYWVCPLIEETEKLDLAHAEARFKVLHDMYPGKVGLIHGRMKKPEREHQMQQFIDGYCKIIVATTVIEVGVDVSDATVIVIENAERFGLSQLHQLRGRVGRGIKQSYCILVYGQTLGKISRQRLKIMKDSNDGFYIADQDLKLRGAGDITGTRQSGMLEFRIFDMNDETHDNLLTTVFNLASKGIKIDECLLKIYS